MERSQAAAAAADVVVMVVDGAEGWTDADADIYKALWGDGPGTAACKVGGGGGSTGGMLDVARCLPLKREQGFGKRGGACCSL